MRQALGIGKSAGSRLGRLRRSRRVRVVGWLVLVPLAVALGGGAQVYVRYAPRWDEGWVDGERHTLGAYAKPTFENTGHRMYEQAIAEMQKPERATAYSQLTLAYDGAYSLPDLERALVDFGPVYSLLHAAADEPCFSVAEPGDYTRDRSVAMESARRDMAFHGGSRAMARGVMGRIRTERRAGRLSESLQAAPDGFALGVNTMQYGGMIDVLVGIAIIAIVQESAAHTLLAGGLPEDEYVAYADRVRGLHGRVPSMEAVLTFEAAVHRDSMIDITPEGAASLIYTYTFTPEEAQWSLDHGGAAPPPRKHTVSQRLREQVLRRTWDGARSIAWTEDRYARFEEQCRLPLDAAGIVGLVERTGTDLQVRGDPVATMMLGSLGQLVCSWVSLHARFTGYETMARLEAYRARHGVYPDLLEDLVPDFAPEVPLDPWNSEPLRYRREGSSYRLYSVGRNRTDDGGAFDPMRPGDSPDEVFAPPRPEQNAWPPGGYMGSPGMGGVGVPPTGSSPGGG